MNEQNGSGDVVKVLARVRGLNEAGRRRVEGCFWAEGVRNFVQAFDAKWPMEAVVLSPVLLRNQLAEKLARRVKQAGIRCVRVSPEQFRSVSVMETASGIGAILRERWVPLEKAELGRGVCWLAVEEIRSPGNLGTILRTAEACGVGGVIFAGAMSDPFHPGVVRASMGGLMHLPLVRCGVGKLREWVRRQDVRVVGLSPEGRSLWGREEKGGAVLLVLGEERKGLSHGLRGMCDELVGLPMRGKADSLNVSVAAGVMMYEMVRRRVM